MTDEHRKVNASELDACVALFAAFYARNGRDPTQDETDLLITTARQMAVDGSALH